MIFREKTLSVDLNVLLEFTQNLGSDLCLTILDETLVQVMRMIPRRPTNLFAFQFQNNNINNLKNQEQKAVSLTKRFALAHQGI